MVGACADDPVGESYDLEALRDPDTCAGCHPDHHRQWSGSMHAYAAEDPVFLAMNERGQRETGGELGDFCVRCHAPLAVELGLTGDGLDLDSVPPHLQGVTCYFCHQVDAAPGEFNNPLTLAHDGLMRGPVADPVQTSVHGHAVSALHASSEFESSRMCGSCHDVVTPADVHLERTFAEWQDSLYADASELDPSRPAPYAQTCNSCHMPSQGGIKIAQTPDARLDRRFHDHHFAGIDVVVTEFPSAESSQAIAAEQKQAALELRDRALCSSLCVGQSADDDQQWTVRLWLHNEAAGHGWPSGAAHDRRAWVELVAEDATDVIWSSGVVEDGVPLSSLQDPELWAFHDRALGPNGDEALMFWDVREVESSALEVAEALGDPEHDTSWIVRDFEISSTTALTKVRSRVMLRPIGLEVIDSLIASGDLDPELRADFEPLTYVISPSVLEWSPAARDLEIGEVEGQTCVSTSPGCKAPFLFGG